MMMGTNEAMEAAMGGTMNMGVVMVVDTVAITKVAMVVKAEEVIIKEDMAEAIHLWDSQFTKEDLIKEVMVEIRGTEVAMEADMVEAMVEEIKVLVVLEVTTDC